MLGVGPHLRASCQLHQKPFLELGCGETSEIISDYVKGYGNKLVFVDIKEPSKKVEGAEYLIADATKMDFAPYNGGTVLIKWMLCHLRDGDAVALLSKLAL